MSLTQVSGHRKVVRRQRELESQIKSSAEKVGNKKIDIATGGVVDGVDVYLMKETGVWASLNPEDNESFWNLFGTEKVTRSRLHIGVQVNPYHGYGINRGLSGAFALDEAGNPFLVHRGHLYKMKTNTVLNAYSGDADFMLEPDGKVARVLVVGQVGSPEFVRQLASFVREMERIKTFRGRQDEMPNLTENTGAYSSEGSPGDGTYLRSSLEVSYKRIHCLIVDELERQMAAYGQTENDQRDLVVMQRGKQKPLLFETKSGCSTSEVYQAIGQLCYYGHRMPRKPRKSIAVFPTELAKVHEEVLKDLGFEVLKYQNKDGDITFLNLVEVLS